MSSVSKIEREFCCFVDQVVPLISPDHMDFFKTITANFINESLRKKQKTSGNEEDKKREVFEIIRDSFKDVDSSNLPVILEKKDIISTSSCISSLNKLIGFEKITHRNLLRCYVLQGEVLQRLKLLSKMNYTKFVKELNETHKIKFSRSYVTLLIKLFKLSKNYPNLANSSLSIYFVMKNFAHLEDYIDREKEEEQQRIAESIFDSPNVQQTEQQHAQHTGLTQELEDLQT